MSISTKQKLQNLKHVNFLNEKHDVLDKCFLVFRPNDIPWLIKPVKVKATTFCAITGMTINPGEYAYPCHDNPLRLTPYGRSRVHILAAAQKGDLILPEGYFSYLIPTTEALKMKKNIKGIEDIKKKALKSEVTKLLS